MLGGGSKRTSASVARHSLTPSQGSFKASDTSSTVGNRVCELFAGVGGFRLGLEKAGWDVVWSNQWEPGRKQQHASECYVRHFGADNHFNDDITKVPASSIPDHDLLVGGFPCQDYSVATTQAEGIHGKKGVLWWEIKRILNVKRPALVLLENVDRLLKSPTKQRGRDFGVMLWYLNWLGYVVEWRVLNAADYGAAQRRRRVFIVAAQPGTALASAMVAETDQRRWLRKTGFFATEFPVLPDVVETLDQGIAPQELDADVQRVSDKFSFAFQNAGMMVNGSFWTAPVKAKPEALAPLRGVLERGVDAKYYVRPTDVPRWKYLKGAKAEKRTAKNGHEYYYSEGPIAFPDALDKPSRTLITSEGRVGPSRFRHLIEDPNTGRLRVLTPSECERLNQFPPGWTSGMPEGWRYFCMGNALVVGLIERIGKQLMAYQAPAGSRARPRPLVHTTPRKPK